MLFNPAGNELNIRPKQVSDGTYLVHFLRVVHTYSVPLYKSITIRYINVQVIQPHVCADVREDNPRALAKPYNILLIAPTCICTLVCALNDVPCYAFEY